MNKFLCLSVGLLASVAVNAQTDFAPPKTKAVPVSENVQGFQMTDYYRWLEDKDNPEVKDWSHSQHNYTVDYIKNHYKEIPGLKEEIKAYLDRDYISAPFFKGKREFFYARKKGDKQSKLYTRIKGKEILIFDPEAIDPSGKSSVSGADFNEDGSKAAIGIQFKGNEIAEYRIINTKNGKVIGEPIPGLRGFSFCKDDKFSYITVGTREMIDKQIPQKTYQHKLGEPLSSDVFLCAPNDAKNYASVWDSDEGGVTFFSEGDFYSTTLKIRKTGTNDEPKQIYSSKQFQASPFVKGDKMYIVTNHEAPNFKIMIADLDKPEFENWRTFYPEQKESVLEGYVITSDYVITQEKKDVLTKIFACDLNGKMLHEIELPETGEVSSISYQKETNTVYVALSTFNSTSKVYKLDGKTLKWEFFYQDTPPIDTKDIVSKLVFYPSKDGTKIPMFVVHKKGVKLDGNNPTLIYGYGGFNISQGPGFVGLTASFINRGGVYALTCLRGGNEYGENWHLNGMMYKKQNTFDDFIAGAEYLINEKYTSPEKLACKGGSNGGLLIGAVTTQRPDLFKAAICAVPLLDMLRYHKFLIARYWIPEYGDPEKKEDFLNILKYSPYQNIKADLSYPTMLVKCGENDTRVDPLHAKKFAAALQNNPGQKNPVMLFIDFDSGHGSGQSIEQMVDNNYLEWKFLMGNLGM